MRRVTKKHPKLWPLLQGARPKLSIQQAARAIGVGEATLYNLVNCRRNPTEETAKKIGRFFRVSPDEIFSQQIVPRSPK